MNAPSLKRDPRKAATTQARIRDEAALALAIEELARLDPEPVGRMLALAGQPPLRRRAAGLMGLAWIVASQQVSAASATAIHGRMEARFPALDAPTLLACADDDLRACGLSAPKIRTLRAIAQAVDAGRLDFETLDRLEVEEARAMLTSVKGIGPWSADVYLLFCLGHPDVWPAGDLALQEGARLALGLRKRPDAARLERIGARWRPQRAAAARLLWAYYGAVRAQARTAARERPRP